MAVTSAEIEAAPKCPECGSTLILIRSNLIACPNGLGHTKLIPIDRLEVAGYKRVQRIAELPIAVRAKKKPSLYTMDGKLYGRAMVKCRHWPGEILARAEFESGWMCIRLVPVNQRTSQDIPATQKSIW